MIIIKTLASKFNLLAVTYIVYTYFSTYSFFLKWHNRSTNPLNLGEKEENFFMEFGVSKLRALEREVGQHGGYHCCLTA